MKLRPIIYGALLVEIAVIAITAMTTVLRPPCYSGSQAYLLAANAGAVIDVRANEDQSSGTAIVVYRPRVERGWASQRLLSRFDLEVELNNAPVVIRNSGNTCRASPPSH